MDGLEGADGESDGDKKEHGARESKHEDAAIGSRGASSCGSFQKNGPESAGGVDDIGGGGVTKDADNQNDKGGLKSDYA